MYNLKYIHSIFNYDNFIFHNFISHHIQYDDNSNKLKTLTEYLQGFSIQLR